MPITITTWNVQNFSKGSKAFEEKLDFLANTLEALGSDVVALQEILDPEALQALADRLSFHAIAGLTRRAAESTTLREISTQLLANEQNIILLGDFNDGPQAATTEALYGPPGSQPRGPDDSTRAFGAFQRKDKGDTQRLFNITNLVPAEIRWTREHKGKKEMLDYILVSEGLMPRDRDGLRQVPKMSILNEDVPNLVSSNPNVGGIVPDHAPVTATFV